MDVYAELTKKTLKQVEDEGFFSLPDGVELNRKSGSRCCYFSCPDEYIEGELLAVLDRREISWQRN